jgi:hypothetical protein
MVAKVLSRPLSRCSEGQLPCPETPFKIVKWLGDAADMN